MILPALVRYAVVTAGVGLTLQSATLSLAQSTPFDPAVRSQFEIEAFQDVQSETDLAFRLDLTESFLIRYPDSELRHLILRARWNVFLLMEDFAAVAGIAETALDAETDFFEGRVASLPEAASLPGYSEALARYQRMRVSYYESLIEAHNGLGNYRDAIPIGEVGLASEAEVWESVEASVEPGSPEYQEALARHDGVEAFFFRNLVEAHEALGNESDVIEFAERALEFAPNDLFTLMTISSTIAKASEREEIQVVAAQRHALRAIGVLDALSAGPDGVSIPRPELARLRSEAHNTLGMLYFHQRQFGSAEEQYLAALEFLPQEPVTYYRMGVAYANDQKRTEAIDALAMSVYLQYSGVEARDALIRVYEEVYGNLEGMEALIDGVSRSLPPN